MFDHRISTVSENITPQGFDLKVGTWGDTSINGVGSTWIAFGQGEQNKKEEKEEVESPNTLSK